MAHKVVYNACYGGFSLSRDAVILARKISGDATWGGTCIMGDKYRNTGETCDSDYGFIRGVPRHDRTLVSVVEEMGGKAGGRNSYLMVHTLESTHYRIDEYDGIETVVEPGDDCWIDASKP